MTEEELTQKNAEFLLQYYRQTNLLSEAPRSQESAVYHAAHAIARECKCQVIKATSEVYKSGSIDMTITDTEGKVFLVRLDSWGSVNTIKDDEGNYVFALVL